MLSAGRRSFSVSNENLQNKKRTRLAAGPSLSFPSFRAFPRDERHAFERLLAEPVRHRPRHRSRRWRGRRDARPRRRGPRTARGVQRRVASGHPRRMAAAGLRVAWDLMMVLVLSLGVPYPVVSRGCRFERMSARARPCMACSPRLGIGGRLVAAADDACLDGRCCREA